jgi:outer membrane protein assembly factor BamB
MIRVLAGSMRRDTARVLRAETARVLRASAGGGKLGGPPGAVNLRAITVRAIALPAVALRTIALRTIALRAVTLRALAICALAAIVLPGCFRVSRAIDDLPQGDWTSRLGTLAHAPFLDERVPLSVRTQWEIDFGRGVTVAPILTDDLILSAVSGGQVLTANAMNGRRHWSRRFNGPVAGQVLRVGSQMIFATQHRSGTLYVIDLHRGRRRWSRRLGSPAIAEPAWADGSIYIATTRDVQAFDAADGDDLWRTRLTGTPVQPPVVLGDELLVAVQDTLLRIARDDGEVRARIALAGQASAPIAVQGDTIVIAMNPGIVAAYVERGAREIWRHAFDAAIVAAPVITPEGVFVLTRSAELHQLGPYSSRRIVALDGAATESLTLTADGALVGTLEGRLVFVRRDGTIIWEERLDGSVRAPAVVHDSEVYVGTLNGRLVKLTSG